MLKLLYKNVLLAAILWTLTIFILCYTPGKYIPTTNWLELLSFDKFVHASIFFVLVVLWLVYFFRIKKVSTVSILLVLIFSIIYGGILEIMQATIFSQRSGDILDFIANTMGCLLGFWFFKRNGSKLTNHL